MVQVGEVRELSVVMVEPMLEVALPLLPQRPELIWMQFPTLVVVEALILN
jgi:hypothetical protein